MDPIALASHVRQLIATWVEPVLDHDAASSSAKRYLKTRREDDGSVRGSFRIAAGDAESVLTALERLARRQGLSDTRSAAQRRADALVEVCEQVLRHGELPDAGGSRPQLSYVVPADWASAGRRAGLLRLLPLLPALDADLRGPRRRRRAQPIDRRERSGGRRWAPPSHHRRGARVRDRRVDRPADEVTHGGAPVRRADQPRPARHRRPGHVCGVAVRRSDPAQRRALAARDSDASPGAAPGRRRCATPTTWLAGRRAGPQSCRTSCCSADATTSCGTSGRSACEICASPG